MSYLRKSINSPYQQQQQSPYQQQQQQQGSIGRQQSSNQQQQQPQVSQYSQSPYDQQQQNFQDQSQYDDSPAFQNTLQQQQQQQQQQQKSQLQQGSSESAFWRSKVEGLQEELHQKNTELQLANQKVRQGSSLEDKVDIVMKNNAQLMEQHNTVQKQLTQKLTECEIWKSKYEKEINEKIVQKSSSELTIKRLNEEIHALKDLSDENQIEKVRQLENTKSELQSKNYTQVKDMKDHHCEDISLYEEKARQFREIISDHEKQLSIYQQKLENQKNESDLEKTALLEEKQRLQVEISQLEKENQQNKELNKTRADVLQSNNIQNLKNHFKVEVDAQASEIDRLKGLLDMKNKEIQALINQNRDQKTNNSDESHGLRQEVQDLRDKIFEINNQKLEEIDDLKQSLEQSHATDLQGLRFHHENQIEALEAEIEKLHQIIENKTAQIDEQIKEKLEQRASYNQEIERLNDITLDLKKDQLNLEKNIQDQKNDYEQQLSTLRINHQVQQEKHGGHNEDLQNQINELKMLLQIKDEDLQTTRQQHESIQEALHKEVGIAKQQSEDWEKQYCKATQDSAFTIDDLNLRLNVLENDQMEQEKKNQITIQSQQEEIKKLQEINSFKGEENSNLKQNQLQTEQEIRELRNDCDKLQDNLNYVEGNKNQELQELRLKLDQSHQYATNSMKQSFDNQVKIMEQEIQELNLRIQMKEREMSSYIDKYNKVEVIIQDFVNHPEKLRDKADVITTKNLYDVLKTSNRSPSKRVYSPIKKSQNNGYNY